MQLENVGILHPGEMGVSIAASARNSGHPVFWVSQGRSLETRQRAEREGFQDTVDLRSLCNRCQAIVSVVPPAVAEQVARQVVGCGFHGLYVDANAISPQRTRRMAEWMGEAGIEFVDGSIIGGPAWQPGRTWLYLSGFQTEQAAALFSAGPLETIPIGSEAGKASALKMCYAAYSKGTTALLCAVLAAAKSLGVLAELEREWSRDGSNFASEAAHRVQRVTAKAWRFAGEMDEISATFAEASLPGEFHAAAAEVYRRIAHFKGRQDLPSLESILQALLKDG